MDQTAPHVSIIIPAWNNWDLTLACLKSLHEHTHTIPYQVILVDNGSTDTTSSLGPQIGKELFADNFEYLSLPDNMGFAKACNHGAMTSKAKYLFFLNNDTTVTPGWLPPLVDAMKGNPRLAGVGPLLLFPDNTLRSKRVQHLGIATFHGPEFTHLYEMFPASHRVVHKRRKLSIITAAALFMPRAVFKAHDGFFEGFVNGMEDVDLCNRISSQGGHFSIVPESIIHHHTSCTPGRFNKENDNLVLLRQRCKHIDETFARLVTEDGFEPAFTPWLTLIARLPDSSAAALQAQYDAHQTLEYLRTLIDKEPLWNSGYGLFIARALAEGDPVLATMTAHLRTLLCPSLAAYEEYDQLMQEHGNRELARKSQKNIHMIERLLSDRDTLMKKASHIERSTNDPLILHALNEWKATNK